MICSVLLASPAQAAWGDGDVWNAFPAFNAAEVPDAETDGAWSPVREILPVGINPSPPPGHTVNPVHAALVVTDGVARIVAFRFSLIQVFDLNAANQASGEHTIDIRLSSDPPGTPDNGHYLPFCAGHTFFPDGRLLIAGGHRAREVTCPGPPCPGGRCYTPILDGWASYYDPVTGSWGEMRGYSTTNMPLSTATADELDPEFLYPQRYYPTVVNLPDGTILLASGDIWNDRNGDLCIDADESGPAAKRFIRTSGPS